MSIVWMAAVVTAMFFGFCAGRMTLTEGGGEEILPETVAAGQSAKRKESLLSGTGDVQTEERGSAEKRDPGKGMLLSGTGDVQTEERRSAEKRGPGKGMLLWGTGDIQTEERGSAEKRGPGKGMLLWGMRELPEEGGERAGALRSREAGREPRSLTGAIGSPVSGQIEEVWQDGDQKVVIRPDEDRIYAPAGGKILKLFPLGNAFLFRTEQGAELYIRVGEGRDELLGRYYRPRVLRNEVVGKGKLLLEFDRQGLEARGISSEVIVTVESSLYGSDITALEGERIRAGEEILRIRRPE